MTRAILQSVVCLTALLALAGAPSAGDDLSRLKGEVRVDGSSTVYPLSEAITEDFGKEARGVRATVGVSGTGGGFKRFCKGEIDACNASRPITKAEREACAQAGIAFIELPLAFDGLCIAVHPKNDWVKSLTVDQVRRIYSAKDTARTWKELDPSWPDRPIKVYSPGTDSGTFDYFREITVGKEGTIRPDMSVREDDNVLVKGVSDDQYAIGYFGLAYYTDTTTGTSGNYFFKLSARIPASFVIHIPWAHFYVLGPIEIVTHSETVKVFIARRGYEPISRKCVIGIALAQIVLCNVETASHP